MSLNPQQVPRETILDIFGVLGISHQDVPHDFLVGGSESTLLDRTQVSDFLQKHFILGTDGTTASFSEDNMFAPVLVGASTVAWGIREGATKTFHVDNRVILKSENRESNSGYRTMEELQMAVCLLKSAKLGSFECTRCPFRDHDCAIKKSKPEPWKWFPGKQGIAFVDLPVEFNFVASMHEGTYTKDFFKHALPHAFEDMKTHGLKIVFITHKAALRPVSDEVISQLDVVIDSMDERAAVLVKKIAAQAKTKAPSIGLLKNLSKQLEDKYFFDFDLLDSWFTGLGMPSPTFKVEPTDLNGNWDELRYHYLTWGYAEKLDGKGLYAPSCWVRAGYTPALSPSDAHLAVCVEMMLGKGHAVSLKLAHTACNLNKGQLVRIYTEQLTKELPVKLQPKLNVKDMNKWSLLKHA